MIYGCDVSFYQDREDTPKQINFQQMKAAGASFVYVRAGQFTWKDPDFDYNWLESRRAGLPRGAYFLQDYRRPIEPQIDKMLEVLKPDPGDLQPWLDFERVAMWDSVPVRSRDLPKMKLMMEAMDSLGRGKAVLYSNPDTIINFLSPIPDWLLERELCIAHYGVKSPRLGPWKEWLYWQYTKSGDGYKHGAESREIDLVYSEKTIEELIIAAGGTPIKKVTLAEWVASVDKFLREHQGYTGPKLEE